MATYAELFPLLQNSELRNKITVAVGVAAEIIREGNDTGSPWDEANHDNRVIWAVQAYTDPATVAQQLHWSIIIANRTFDIEQILAASDEAIQDNVNSVVDIFTTGS